MKTVLFALALALPFLAKAQSDSLDFAIAPGLTPVPANGRTEIGFFNTFASYRTDTLGYRGAQLTNFLQIQRGMSRQNRFSAGVDLVFSNLRFGPTSEIVPFGSLGPAPKLGLAIHTLSAVGLRARFVPFLEHYEFTVQGSVYFPVSTQQNRQSLGEDRTRFSVQGNYATLFAPGWYAIAQVSPQVRARNDDRDQTTWELPLNAYLVRRVLTTARRQRLYVYGGAGYFSSFEKRYKAGLRQVNWNFSAGAGAQWVFNPQWSLSLGWQGLPVFDASTGIKKGSYAAISVGARYVGLR